MMGAAKKKTSKGFVDFDADDIFIDDEYFDVEANQQDNSDLFEDDNTEELDFDTNYGRMSDMSDEMSDVLDDWN